jgi:hypothetical protein
MPKPRCCISGNTASLDPNRALTPEECNDGSRGGTDAARATRPMLMLEGAHYDVRQRSPLFVVLTLLGNKKPPTALESGRSKTKPALMRARLKWSFQTLMWAIAFLVAAFPAAAQVATTETTQQQLSGQSELQTAAQAATTSQAPTTGVVCIEEMLATFCNVPAGPNTSGYGSSGGSGSSSGAGSGVGTGSNASSTPICGTEPPFNELCD